MKYIIIVLLSLSLFSCNTTLDINEDPTTSINATNDVVLPAAQVNLAVAISRFNNLIAPWGQYWAGGPGVGTPGMEKYNMSSVDNNTAWQSSYSGALQDMFYLINSTDLQYRGVGKVMSAYLYQVLVDLHGDIPFSEATRGAKEYGSVITPKYDKDTAIYTSLITMLNEGIDDISNGGDITSNADVIFSGSKSGWIGFANAIKLKIFVKRNQIAAAKQLAESGAIFNGARIVPTTTTRNTNPLYSLNTGSTLGMIQRAATGALAYLNNTFDPRINGYYARPLSPTGAPHKSINTGDVNLNPIYELVGTETATDARNKYSTANSIVFGATVPVYFISSWEINFLLAELYTRNDEFVVAESYFDQAITQSFASVSIALPASFLPAISFSTKTKDEMLNTIGIQKWVSMNGLQMTEGWLETVRFDRPGNEIFTNAATGIFTDPIQNNLGVRKYPSSLVYPQNEIGANPNTPTGRTITDKRFWDL